jgi:hypothetical protein
LKIYIMDVLELYIDGGRQEYKTINYQYRGFFKIKLFKKVR